jgi:hypothetical protein
VDFDFEIVINRPVEDVYNFLWTMDERDFSNNKLVPVYEKVTEGPRRIGSVIREVIKTRYFTIEMFSEITEYMPNRILAYRFQGAGMEGTLRYVIKTVEDGTKLNQMVSISFRGLMKILNPLLPLTYARKADWRLRAIKGILEKASPT